METFKNLSDHDLFEKCRSYGMNAKLWMRKFVGLLPEANRRKLYEKKGFPSIHVFAYELAGMTKEQVDRTLQLDRDFEDKPILRNMLQTGEIGMHTLARVNSIATKETEEYWAKQAKILPKSSLETLIRDHRTLEQKSCNLVPGRENGPSLFGQNEQSEVEMIGREQSEMQITANGSNQAGLAPVAGFTPASILKLQLSGIVIEKLLELQQKGIDINELILNTLQNREQEIADEKEKLSQELKPTNSRYIPVAVRKILKEEHGNKCSISHCHKPAAEIHHTQRFSIAKTHDPHYIAPLCADHHKIAHSIDLKYQEHRKPEG